MDPYSSSKASAEIIFESFVNSYDLNKYKTNCASVRAGNVIGGGDFNQNRLIPDIVKSYFNRKNISIKPKFCKTMAICVRAIIRLFKIRPNTIK